MRQRRAQKPDVEELAKKARENREESCRVGNDKNLQVHNCQQTVVVRIGDALIPLSSILNLPIFILISSK